MSERLTWEEIKQRYKNEWVELVDFEWDETELDPKSGVVHVHSKDRKEFDKLICHGRVKESAIVYTGELETFRL